MRHIISVTFIIIHHHWNGYHKYITTFYFYNITRWCPFVNSQYPPFSILQVIFKSLTGQIKHRNSKGILDL